MTDDTVYYVGWFVDGELVSYRGGPDGAPLILSDALVAMDEEYTRLGGRGKSAIAVSLVTGAEIRYTVANRAVNR